MEDTTKVCMNSSPTSAGTSVLRSASDTAITTVAEAWELSLAAASASKDKRVKDVKNTSLKQQNNKKRQTKTSNDASVLSVTDGEYTRLYAHWTPIDAYYLLNNIIKYKVVCSTFVE